MRILVLSDIHANIWALEAIMNAEKKYDQLFFAGDMVDYGIAPSQVIDWFQKATSALIVQGNHDRMAVNAFRREDFHHMPSKSYRWLHFNLERMTMEQINYLESLPVHQLFYADGWTYLMKHEYITGTYDMIESRAQFESYWREHTPELYWNAPKRRMIFGHSHRQCIHVLGEGMEWINPGSASYRRPDDPDKTAHYMVIEDGIVGIRRVSYDREPLHEEALRQLKEGRMMDSELQYFMFHFGNASTVSEALPELGYPQ